MSYHCRIGEGLRVVGLTPSEAHIACDGCGKTLEVAFKGGLPPVWLMRGNAAPGWGLTIDVSHGGHIRKDYCPVCPNPGFTIGTRTAP